MGKTVYVVIAGDQITTDDGIFQDYQNVAAVYDAKKGALDHIDRFVKMFEASDIYRSLSWKRDYYIPFVSDIEKGWGTEFTVDGEERTNIKVNRRVFCHYEEVEITEVTENGSASGDSGVARPDGGSV